MEPAPKKKDKAAETNEEIFRDDMEFDSDMKRRRIVSQIGKRDAAVELLPLGDNLPMVKDQMRRTINRFNRFKRATVVPSGYMQADVDLYDFDYSLSKNMDKTAIYEP